MSIGQQEYSDARAALDRYGGIRGLEPYGATLLFPEIVAVKLPGAWGIEHQGTVGTQSAEALEFTHLILSDMSTAVGGVVDQALTYGSDISTQTLSLAADHVALRQASLTLVNDMVGTGGMKLDVANNTVHTLMGPFQKELDELFTELSDAVAAHLRDSLSQSHKSVVRPHVGSIDVSSVARGIAGALTSHLERNIEQGGIQRPRVQLKKEHGFDRFVRETERRVSDNALTILGRAQENLATILGAGGNVNVAQGLTELNIDYLRTAGIRQPGDTAAILAASERRVRTLEENSTVAYVEGASPDRLPPHSLRVTGSEQIVASDASATLSRSLADIVAQMSDAVARARLPLYEQFQYNLREYASQFDLTTEAGRRKFFNTAFLAAVSGAMLSAGLVGALDSHHAPNAGGTVHLAGASIAYFDHFVQKTALTVFTVLCATACSSSNPSRPPNMPVPPGVSGSPRETKTPAPPPETPTLSSADALRVFPMTTPPAGSGEYPVSVYNRSVELFQRAAAVKLIALGVTLENPGVLFTVGGNASGPLFLDVGVAGELPGAKDIQGLKGTPLLLRSNADGSVDVVKLDKPSDGLVYAINGNGNVIVVDKDDKSFPPKTWGFVGTDGRLSETPSIKVLRGDGYKVRNDKGDQIASIIAGQRVQVTEVSEVVDSTGKTSSFRIRVKGIPLPDDSGVITVSFDELNSLVRLSLGADASKAIITATPPPTATRQATPTEAPTKAPTPFPNDEYTGVKSADPMRDVPTYGGHVDMSKIPSTRANAEEVFSMQNGALGVKKIGLEGLPDGKKSYDALTANPRRATYGTDTTLVADFFETGRAILTSETDSAGNPLFFIEHWISRKDANGNGKNVMARFWMSTKAKVWANADRTSVFVYEVPGLTASPGLVRPGDVVGVYADNIADNVASFLAQDFPDGAVPVLDIYRYPGSALIIIPR